MLLNIETQPSKSKRGRQTRRIIHLKCDECGEEFERRYQKHLLEKLYHFCSRKCTHVAKKPGGLIRKKTERTYREKHGVNHHWQTNESQEQRRQIWQEKYGVDNPSQIESVKEKKRQTTLRNYGVDNPSKSKDIKERRRQASIEKFGVPHHWLDPAIRGKRKETWLTNLGVDHPMKSAAIKAQVNWIEAAKKQHQTKKQNGSYGTSNAEDLFADRLQKLAQLPVERSVKIKHDSGLWIIDFKVGDTYIQFDGVYWHGLDRPLTEIAKFRNPRDKSIHATYLKDRRQDEFFMQHNLRLARITDEQERVMSDDEIRVLLGV